jgi:hypothetical protein
MVKADWRSAKRGIKAIKKSIIIENEKHSSWNFALAGRFATYLRTENTCVGRREAEIKREEPSRPRAAK